MKSSPSDERIAGVDGCKSGWLCISQGIQGGDYRSEVFADAKSLIEQTSSLLMMTVDVPIGLVDRGERECDRIARSMLARRASCVVVAPSRETLAGTARGAGSLIDRVRDFDEALRPEHQARVREVHPELSFMHWNCGEPLAHGKKTSTGRQLRTAFVAENFGPDAFAIVRREHARSDVGDDDICDAFAALFTARRICHGSAQPVPDQPLWDARGLRMEMWV